MFEIAGGILLAIAILVFLPVIIAIAAYAAGVVILLFIAFIAYYGINSASYETQLFIFICFIGFLIWGLFVFARMNYKHRAKEMKLKFLEEEKSQLMNEGAYRNRSKIKQITEQIEILKKG